jgi:hypothetical protein
MVLGMTKMSVSWVFIMRRESSSRADRLLLEARYCRDIPAVGRSSFLVIGIRGLFCRSQNSCKRLAILDERNHGVAHRIDHGVDNSIMNFDLKVKQQMNVVERKWYADGSP